MLKKNSTTTTKNGGVISSSIINNNNWSRVCDTCRSAACKVYCHADSAYLCSGCDASIHAANRVASRHERVLVCEACERAPAAFFCKADAASLCSSCDAEIHSANALASRHQRVPLFPFSGCLKQHHHHHLRDRDHEDDEEVVDEEEDEGEAEAASWLLLNSVKNNEEDSETGGFLFDEYLDLVDCNSCGDDDDNNKFSNVYYDNHREKEHNYSTVPQSYAVVPVQCGGEGEGQAHVQQQFQHGFDFDSSKAGFSYDGSLSQSVSVSSMDVGVIPESTISDISISHSISSIGTSDLFAPIPMPSHLTPIDREAKVLRYREKKKTRKFEKKIRYVSRKAYAENRPRIKGRFAKRTDIEADQVDQMHSTTLITEAGCSIVPSFQISS